ncbi:DUF5817 domain-containing protein [Halomicroarcula sp. S1AR25-4]|uniref:DUF5817 domain-containing protein n=1 Tax=Haloarcula sp. S1AR25-4 TaxID=2950538 RepID=UPI002874D5B1|nr:DUF5817 domain-containing protein [Halomicroarcula sp. S1AR25-4]MDS0280024.1 DUF5817 domain-containing protein [Halomicroarcula sp. S1AR25-4]
MSKPQYAIVGCRECGHRWVTDQHEHTETVECPRCGHRRDRDKVKTFFAHDEWHTVCDVRSQMQADRAGLREEYDDVDHYADLEEQAEAHLQRYDDVLADEADAAGLGQFDDRYEALVDVSNVVGKERYAEFVDTTPVGTGRFSAQVEQSMAEFRARTGADDARAGLATSIAPTDPPRDPDAGLSFVDDVPVSADHVLTLDGRPYSALWQELASAPEIYSSFVAGVRDLLSRRAWTSGPDLRALVEAGVSVADGRFATRVTGLDKPTDVRDHAAAYRALRRFGTDAADGYGHPGVDGFASGPAAILAAAEIDTPTVAVVVPESFKTQRRDQREAICTMLDALGRGVDVQLVAPRLRRRWLCAKHDDELPAELREQCNGRQPDALDEAAAERYLLETGVNAKPVQLLETLYNADGQTCSYGELADRLCVGRARISTLVGDLVGGEFVFSPRGETSVELLHSGTVVVDVLRAEFGEQASLESSFSEKSNCSDDTRVTTPTRDGPPSPAGQTNRRGTGLATVRPMPRWQAAAAAGCAETADVTLHDAEIGEYDDRREPRVWCDRDADRVVTSVEYCGPLPMWTTVARALTSTTVWDHVLTDARVEDSEEFADLLTDHKYLLREGRCLGSLPDDVETFGDYREQLIELREEMLEMTRDLRHENYEDRKDLRSDILRLAHGLAGTMAHIFDILGIDLVREIRVPNCSRDFDFTDSGGWDVDDFAFTLAHGAAIQSHWGMFSAFRCLFEPDEDKRQTAIFPEVDADDPHAELIGSFVVVGDGVDRLQDAVETALGEPHAVQDDAPEMDLPFTVSSTPGIEATKAAATKVLTPKNLRPADGPLRMLQALTLSPYTAARTLHRTLSEEEYGRELRYQEVRTACRSLDDADLLPGHTGSTKAIVATVLETDDPLTKTELAERTGYTAETVANNLAPLDALDMVTETPSGYRFQLPTSAAEERQTDSLPVPSALTDGHTTHRDLLTDLAMRIVGDPAEYADPERPLGKALVQWPPDFETAYEAHDDLAPWQPVIDALTAPEEPATKTVTAGVDVQQQGLSTIAD